MLSLLDQLLVRAVQALLIPLLIVRLPAAVVVVVALQQLTARVAPEAVALA